MIGELGEALTAARSAEQETIATAMVEDGFLGITGDGGVGKTVLTGRVAALLNAAGTARVVSVDLLGAYSMAKLIARWRHALFQTVVGHPAASQVAALDRSFWSAATQHAVLAARELFGDQFDAALTEQPPRSAAPADLSEPLEITARFAERSPAPCVLLIDHLQAPLLTSRHPVHPRDMLWQIRSAAQAEPKLHVVVVCAPGSEELASDAQAAFYGDGTWLTVTAPSPARWTEAAVNARTAVDPAWVELGRRHVPTILGMLRARESGVRDSREAFRAVAESQHEHASRCVLHAASLHRLGAHVLVSIANGGGAYAGTPEARSDDVAAAVKQLLQAGLIRRDPDDARGWLLVDPTVQWLLADVPNVRDSEPIPRYTVTPV